MYRATVSGDLVAAEILLQRDPNLASDEISEEGDRALHVAAAFKHQKLVEKLVRIMSPGDLTLLDGHGYTACCYAAIAGSVDIADLMMRKNATLATARDRENKTPMHKAAFRGNAKMVRHFLKSVKVVGLLSKEEWFDLLLVSIRRKMFGAALEILMKNDEVATMRNVDDEETALHLLAGQKFFVIRKWWKRGVRQQDVLAKKLWEGVERLGEAGAVELVKNPSVLHAAAKVGNVELITMITHTYPHLVWHTDREGHTIFHIAVKYRKENLFALIDEIGARIDLIAVTPDENGNNILHLAAELGVLDKRAPRIPNMRLEREITWFKKVDAVVPPCCWEMRNNEGHTPFELFKKDHRNMAEKSGKWSSGIANTWMLISTLIFSVVFASAFAVPGGYNQSTGIPVLYKSRWFTCSIIFEAFAMFASAWSMFWFSKTMMWNELVLEPVDQQQIYKMRNGFLWLLLSVAGTMSVFMSTYLLVYVEERPAFVTSFLVILYATFVFYCFLWGFNFTGYSRGRFQKNGHSLFKRSTR